MSPVDALSKVAIIFALGAIVYMLLDFASSPDVNETKIAIVGGIVSVSYTHLTLPTTPYV